MQINLMILKSRMTGENSSVSKNCRKASKGPTLKAISEESKLTEHARLNEEVEELAERRRYRNNVTKQKRQPQIHELLKPAEETLQVTIC